MRYDGGEGEVPAERSSRPGLLDVLRKLALSAERAAAREAAGSVVRGATEELREQFPELDGELQELLSDAFTALRRVVRSAAKAGDGTLDETAHSISEAAMRGALDELERQWREGGLPLHDFGEKLNRLLDQVADFAGSRAEHFKNPASRAHTIAASAIDGASSRLRETLPELREGLHTLLPMAHEAAKEVGDGLAQGLVGGTKKHSDELTRALEGAGAAIARGLTAGFVASAKSGVQAVEELGPNLVPLATSTAGAVAKGAAAAVIDEVREAATRAGKASASAARALVRSPGFRKGAAQRIATVAAGGVLTIGAYALGRRSR